MADQPSQLDRQVGTSRANGTLVCHLTDRFRRSFDDLVLGNPSLLDRVDCW